MQYNNDTQIEYPFMEIEIETLSKELSIAILIILALLFIIGLILNAISLIAILNNKKKLEIISILILIPLILNLIFSKIMVYNFKIFFFSKTIFYFINLFSKINIDQLISNKFERWT